MNRLNKHADQPFDVMIDKKIANLAYHYWEQRGRPNGSPEVDWYRAVDDIDRGFGACAGVITTAVTAERSPSSIARDRTIEIANHDSKQVELKGGQQMSGKKVGVFGIYASRLAVENATDSLIRAGFPASDISVLMPETSGGAKHMGTEKTTKAPEGTAAGVTAGGAIGGTLGVLAGVGLLAIPGLGPFIAAGPIMAGLAGFGVGGAVGGVTGAFIGMGISEFEAKRYEGHLQKGGILLSVHCDTPGEIMRAKEVVKSTGGEEVTSTGESSIDTDKTADHNIASKAARGTN